MMSTKIDAVATVVRRAYAPTPGPGNPWPLFASSLKNILMKPKKTPLLLLFLLLPLVVTIFISSTLDTYAPDDTSAPARGGLAWFEDIMGRMFFPLIMPIV